MFYPDTQEWESPRVAADLRLIPGAARAVAGLREAGWAVFLVSNQPSFAKGKTTLAALREVHAALLAGLDQAGAGLDGASYCFHHPQGIVAGYSGPCLCRKPSPFLLQEAARGRGLLLAASWMVGDQDMDVLCGRNAGCRTILIPCEASRAKRGNHAPDHLCTELAEILPILGRPRSGPLPGAEPQ